MGDELIGAVGFPLPFSESPVGFVGALLLRTDFQPPSGCLGASGATGVGGAPSGGAPELAAGGAGFGSAELRDRTSVATGFTVPSTDSGNCALPLLAVDECGRESGTVRSKLFLRLKNVSAPSTTTPSAMNPVLGLEETSTVEVFEAAAPVPVVAGPDGPGCAALG
jgi:hypothetical protein